MDQGSEYNRRVFDSCESFGGNDSSQARPTLPRFPDFSGGARGVDLLAFSGGVNENRQNLAR
jgi:hypothetical protein